MRHHQFKNHASELSNTTLMSLHIILKQVVWKKHQWNSFLLQLKLSIFCFREKLQVQKEMKLPVLSFPEWSPCFYFGWFLFLFILYILNHNSKWKTIFETSVCTWHNFCWIFFHKEIWNVPTFPPTIWSKNKIKMMQPFLKWTVWPSYRSTP